TGESTAAQDLGHWPAELLERYTITSEAHRGGQGAVYAAIQKSTGRRVAIKIMREGPLGRREDALRFEREVQILGQLNHPNIVGILDSGVSRGLFYFVMDYVEGQSLGAWMTRRGAPTSSIAEPLKLFLKICQAIHAAHLRGVIHRDLKPGNIQI